jgi:hypothetical protein
MTPRCSADLSHCFRHFQFHLRDLPTEARIL